MIVTILAPFVVFNILFGVGFIFTHNNIVYYFINSFLMAMHISGCIGDLYGAYIMIFKYKKKDILVNDTGPKQTFYVKN